MKGSGVTTKLVAAGYICEIDIDGDPRKFHVDVVCRHDSYPTSIHFNEFADSSGIRRTSFGIHLPAELWRPAKEGGLEVVSRKAISQALRSGWFDVSGHREYDVVFNEIAECWPGVLRRA